MSASTSPVPPYIAVGGVGGSGTRLIAALLAEFGIFLGHDLNEAFDNLAFTLLFKRREILTCSDAEVDSDLALFSKAMNQSGTLAEEEKERVFLLAETRRPQHGAAWLRERAKRLVEFDRPAANPNVCWGWKEPNTHILLPALIRNFPDLRYIHVARNGLDMAFSGNQNQLAYWADALLGYPGESSPSRSLSYWCAVQRRACSFGSVLGERFLWLNYDDFCLRSEAGLGRLSSFLGLPMPAMALLRTMIRPPQSTGRYRQADCSQFSREDIETVRQFGFSVT